MASGSPFDDVVHEGERYAIGQGNNAFVFPGIGFAAILGRCRRISDAMIIESAFALADYTKHHRPSGDRIFPPISDLKEVSVEVASRVLEVALRDGSATRDDLVGGVRSTLAEFVRSRMWQPKYLPYRLTEGSP